MICTLQKHRQLSNFWTKFLQWHISRNKISAMLFCHAVLLTSRAWTVTLITLVSFDTTCLDLPISRFCSVTLPTTNYQLHLFGCSPLTSSDIFYCCQIITCPETNVLSADLQSNLEIKLSGDDWATIKSASSALSKYSTSLLTWPTV